MRFLIYSFFLCMLIWCLPGLNAQGQYLPTVVEGNHWTIRKHQGMGNFIDYGVALTCDTVIQNKRYLEVWEDAGQLLGWAREDTTSQSIYYWMVSEPEESLILSYQVQPNDTFWVNNVPVICDSVTFTLAYGAIRKIIHFDPVLKFIEGIGNSMYGIHDFGFYQTIETFTPDSVFCMPTTALDPVLSKMDWRAYPNPTSDILEFSFSGKLPESILLTDLTGRTMIQVMPPFQSPMRIDIGQWPNGIYLLLINGLFAQKVIKHE
ncbi:MAG: T9SS type A sorting domain-containing protein [Saprospiraceae bacterium]|nr:T9SS type A sorting domain-containing protein [Saprospiraceae bacterium]